MQDELRILLIEDNPGDVQLITEVLRDAEDLLQRVDVGRSIDGIPQVHHEVRLADGLDHLESNDVDVILLDLNLPDSRGLDSLTSVVDATETHPIVVLTGLDDRQIGIDAIQQGAQDHLVKDEVNGDALVRTIYQAIERKRQERVQVGRRKQLEVLNDLNQIVQDVTHIVITAATREELEQEICSRLAASDAYRFAWIGEVKRGTDRVIPRVAAGVEEGYLNEISINIDDETGRGPTGKAIRTHEVQVVQDIQTDPDYEPWRGKANEYGYQSSAAIPIVHEGVRYGVLNVYAASPYAFSEPEAEILTRLGDVIGHAIAAIERKEALVSDAVLELEFRADGLADELIAFCSERSGRIRIEKLTSYDDAVRAYGTASGFSETELREAIEGADSVDDYRSLPSIADESRFGFEFSIPSARPLVESVATHCGRIRSMTVADGDLRIVVEFPRGNDTRRMIAVVEEYTADAFLVSQRTTRRSVDEGDPQSVLRNLTEKQREALTAAHMAGYFNWPRTSNATEMAERLGVSSATFTQHLRTAERKVFDAILPGNSVEKTDTDPDEETEATLETMTDET